MEGTGAEWTGKAGEDGTGLDRNGEERIGEAVMDWRGMDRTREDRRGKAGVTDSFPP